MTDQPLELLDHALERARRLGADAADAVLVSSVSLSHAERLGKVERLEREEGRDLGLRVLVGRRQAIASTSDLAPEALEALAERAVAMARSVPEDRFLGLAEPAALMATVPDLDLLDPDEPSTETLAERARVCEEAARAVEGVTNSEGAEASWGLTRVALAASNGFRGEYARSSHALAASVIAGSGDAMERDYEFATSVHGADLEDPETIGRRAGEQTVARLGPRKIDGGQVPVVFAPRVASSLLRHLAGAVSGTAVARGTSFLKDRLGEAVFAEGIRILDDPSLPRGRRSRPFDGEGLAGAVLAIVENGTLASWLLDLRTARQLGLESTGHAARGISSAPSPSPTNLYLAAGDMSPEALIGEIESGLYVTELMGMGVNAVTGDYSRGAAGFWIEKGEKVHPVSELTIAGNLKDVFRTVTPASDLEFRFGMNAPTLRVDSLTVAGG